MSKRSRLLRRLRRHGLKQQPVNPELVGKIGVYLFSPALREKIEKVATEAKERRAARAEEKRKRKATRNMVVVAQLSVRSQS